MQFLLFIARLAPLYSNYLFSGAVACVFLIIFVYNVALLLLAFWASLNLDFFVIMDKKLFLVDAYALIYRAYFAFMKNPLINSKGFNTSPVMGFFRVIDDVLDNEHPTHLAVAFDGNVRPFRFKIYDQYKAQREKTPEDILEAVPVIKQILQAYRIPILEVDSSEYDAGDQRYSYEADDIIGTISHKAAQLGYEVYMLTPDKDYAQLLDDHVYMYRPRQGGGYDVIGLPQLKEKWGVERPEQMIDYLALVGDASDNIPGCAGIGPVTATKLISEFGSVDNLLASVDKLKGVTKTKVETSADNIKLSYFLAKICKSVPVDFEEENCKVENPNLDELLKLFSDYELKSLLKKHSPVVADNGPVQLSLFDSSPIVQSGENKFENLSDLKSIPHSYQLVDNEEKIDALVAKILAENFVSFDTETTGTDTFVADLVGMSFAWSEGESYFVILPEDKSEAQKIVDKFKPIFENDKIEKIGQNMKFDILMLSHYGVEVRGQFFDTMLAHYLLQPEQRHNMDYLAEVYLNYRTVTYEEMSRDESGRELPIRKVPVTRLAEYAAEDADVTLKLKNKLLPELEKNNLLDLFTKVEMPLVHVLVKMELAGVRVDVDALGALSKSMNAEMLNIEQQVYADAGYQFNISSPRQVGELIYDKLKVADKPKKTKTGQYSTTEAILESFKGKSPVIDKILDFRAYKKLVSTYVDSLPKLINPVTGKIHTSYNQAVTATGRLSSSDPNLQNIPVRDDLGRDIRRAFIPDDGCTFLSADYSQIELRVMAHLSKDQNLMDAFNRGVDVHADTASKIFEVPIEEVTSDMRRKAKTANFGIIYGISAFGLAQRLDIPRGEAKDFIDGYFRTYPQVKAYMDKSIEVAREQGYVETLLHRKRFLPDINSRNGNVRGFAERNAINAPIQGTAADIIKIAMIRIMRCLEQEHLKSVMTMQVHDELNFSVFPDELERVREIVVREMQGAMQLDVPLIVDCGVGENWLIAH